jgi:ribose-phosphate pyrophosphokinase
MILLNGQEIKFESFPNGETRIVEPMNFQFYEPFQHLLFKYENDSDLIRLFLTKKYMENRNFNAVRLTIAYMPYSRMDRSENGSPFTLKYISEFINDLGFTSVEVIEPHSDVTTALLNRATANFVNFKLIEEVKKEVLFDEDTDYLVFPDAGAQKRYSKMKSKNQLVCFKNRDFETGKITSLDLVGDVLYTDFKAVIVDDLCSYGGTFMATAEELIEAGAQEIYLLVAHCEESIFKGKIFETDVIDKVFTTNSILNVNPDWHKQKYADRIKVYEIFGK